MASWNLRAILMNLSRQPHVAMIFHRPSQLTEKQAFDRSTIVMQRSLFCSWRCSRSNRVANNMSTIPRPFIRHTDFLGGGHPPSAGIRRLERTLTTILPATIRCSVTKSLRDCRMIVYFPLSYRDFNRGNLDFLLPEGLKILGKFL